MKKNVIYVAIAIMSWLLLYSFIDIYSYTVREGVDPQDIDPSDNVKSTTSSAKPVIPLGSSAKPVIPLGSSAKPVIPLGSSAKPVIPLGSSAKPNIPLGSSTNPAISLGSSSKSTNSLGSSPNYDSSTNPAISLGSSTKRGNRKKFASFNKNNKIENNTKEIADLKGKMTNFNNNNISLLNELQTNISKSINKNKQHMNL
jgi:hypothetical protein